MLPKNISEKADTAKAKATEKNDMKFNVLLRGPDQLKLAFVP